MKRYLSHKYILVFLILLIAIPFVVILTVTRNSKTEQSSETTLAPTQRAVPKTASLYFSPQQVTITTPQTVSVDVMVNTGNAPISGAQVTLHYDPKILTNMKILPATEKNSLIGTDSFVLKEDVDTQTGVISYAVGVAPQAASKKGNGKIATLTFYVNSFKENETRILFTPDTLVTTDTETQSVLKDVLPLTIQFTQPAQ